MTPKEQADFLIHKYSNILWDTDVKIECALIAVDLILNNEPKKAYFIKGSWITPKNYWNEVKLILENHE